MENGHKGAPWASSASAPRAHPTFEFRHRVPRLLGRHFHRLRSLAVRDVHLDHAKVTQEEHWVDALATAFNVLQYLQTPVGLELTYILLQEEVVEAQVVVRLRLEMQDVESGQDLIHPEDVRPLSERDEERVDDHGDQQHIDHEVDEAEQLEDADGDELALEAIGDAAVVSQDPGLDAADKLVGQRREAEVIAQVGAGGQHDAERQQPAADVLED